MAAFQFGEAAGGVADAAGDLLLHPAGPVSVAHLLVVGGAAVRGDPVRGHLDGAPQLRQLPLFLGVLALPLVAAGVLGGQVGAVAAAEADRAVHRRVEVEQIGADRVEERPVVAGDDHRAGQGAELVLQERGGPVVEVVGGLVEQDRRGPPDQQRGEGEAPALAARERAEDAVGADGGQAEAVEQQGGAAVGVPGFAVLRLFEAGAVGGEQRGLARAAVREGGQLLAEAVEFGEVGAGFAERLVQHGGDGGGGVERHLLVQEAEVGGPGDASGVGLVDAGQHPQQGGLAAAVLADQAEPAAGGGGQ